ncbi:hypothetical protein WICPIJ_004725 [Wickerhamomyces pijperi]|uniref:tRNA (adenine(58)-N(1))-methyltransferase non-catalytic subunit TRM6 n=1 Tax=Wickerhamomyces pijperi TaxID=599730 RepID=A0A9P8TN09_WICPI|nr:hypothetical protein WICPIJ_004725 [Wickerhamomyces pijperi]
MSEEPQYSIPTVIQHGLHAIIRMPSEAKKIITLEKGKSINLGKFGIFDIDEIIGYPYGQTFEVLDNHKVRAIGATIYDTIDPAGDNEQEEGAEEAEATPAPESANATPIPETLSEKIDYLKKLDVQSSSDNRNIVDIGTAQSLSMEDIEELKKTASGANVGEAIIDKLIKSHETFHQKTKQSQEKYLRRKQQKFLRRFTVEYVSSSNLLQYFIEKDASKVLDMSLQSMGMLLTLGNIQPGGRYLVVDETGGLIVAAMLERMQGRGEIMVLHENEHPNHSVLTHTDYPQAMLDRMVKSINILQFFEPEEERVQFQEYTPEQLKELKSNKRTHYYRRKQNAEQINAVIDNAVSGNFHAAILATTLHLNTFLPKLIPSLGGSRPIVAYSQFKEPLVSLQIQSLSDLNLLAPTLQESRCRPYQTIPGRLHPLMTMRGGGGFLYSALKVFPLEKVQAVGRTGVKKQKIVNGEAKVVGEKNKQKETTEI